MKTDIATKVTQVNNYVRIDESSGHTSELLIHHPEIKDYHERLINTLKLHGDGLVWEIQQRVQRLATINRALESIKCEQDAKILEQLNS